MHEVKRRHRSPSEMQIQLGWFKQLAGDRLIVVDELRVPSGALIRRFRPTMSGDPWEIQVATTDDGMEQFAVSINPLLEQEAMVSVTIRPSRERPIHLERVFDDAGWKGLTLAQDGYHRNRYRYCHPIEGPVDWFVIRVVSPVRPEGWLFEHPSLYSQLCRERPALPAPAVRTLSPTGIEHEGLSLVPINAKVDSVADELARLRTELPELIKTQRRYEESDAATEERLEQILKSAAATKRMKERIDVLEDLDAGQKEQLHLTIDAAFDKAIERFKRSIDIELE